MPESAIDAGLLDPLSHGTRAVELTSDAAWLGAFVDVEIALSRSLAAAGLVPDWMDAVCDELADAPRLDLAAIAASGRDGGNPVIPLVKHLGQAAEAIRAGASDHLHVGATSQDILDSAAMLVARTVLVEVERQLGALAAEFASLADRHRSTAMTGRTLGQHASPTSFGLVAAGWLEAALSAIETVRSLIDTLPLQLGGAVGDLAVLTEIARARVPESPSAAVVDGVLGRFGTELGLAVPRLAWHTNRLPVCEIASALAAAVGVVGKFALDVSILSRTELGELGERLESGQGGSSAMPHKRNPITAVLVVSAARQAPAHLAALYGGLLAEDQRPSGAWHAEWQPLRELERLAVSAVSGAVALAGRLDVDSSRMAANLDLTDGLVFSERATTVLADLVGRSAAFSMVERASREAVATRRPLQIVLAGLLAAEGRDDSLRSRVWDAFDSTAEVGTASAAIDRVLDHHRTVARRPDRLKMES
jgi:3-carboxy-cis,cis-muconate cycloisomerase